MTIEIDGDNSGLPPLKPKKEPLIAVTEIIAVDTEHLVGGEVPVRKLLRFYVDMLGLAIDEPRAADMALRHEKLRVEFVRTHAAAMTASGEDLERTGKLMLHIRQFDTALRVLDDEQIAYEQVHHEMGMCRAATLFDPAGNLVMLMELRTL